MTNQTANIIAFPYNPQPPGNALSDAQMFWEWKMKTADYLNLVAERGREVPEEIKEEVRKINGFMIELGYSPLIVDF